MRNTPYSNLYRGASEFLHTVGQASRRIDLLGITAKRALRVDNAYKALGQAQLEVVRGLPKRTDMLHGKILQMQSDVVEDINDNAENAREEAIVERLSGNAESSLG